ncbi:MAG: hypothetical protein ACXACD_22445 [Candidatus Thorarchaeota archaeon]
MNQYDKRQLAEMVAAVHAQISDIPGVSLEAKISVLRLWAEPEMDARRMVDAYDAAQAVTDSESTRYVPPGAAHLFEVDDAE